MISTTKEREEELKKLESFNRELVRKVPVPMSISDPNGKRLDVNEAFERFHMCSREEVIGSSVEKSHTEDSISAIREALERCRKEEYSSCEVVSIRGDGVEMPVILNFSALKDEKGNVTNIIMTATDVTELKKREKDQKDGKLS
ncbi:MAG: PAS domain S-box protein [Candidatus Methanoliparum thermophilum]|uniref:PAS domain S-box protein n=1 Tax=Methanoliparum thermophilum TaxID=2491083 RepID=A0A520KR62_METT2|nr:PAS domain-containing protein [Candidatus Methanoliparum sp. LAM-1]RZN64115.1 MAG: PAS domain S-box protein [Candidatus Methanoliparum thermophilum]BDC35622.1 hypothetical protein MTLP_03040 [Candidatus Methanoliparum sp. LAM-1]